MQAGDFTAKKEIVWLERRGIEEGVSIPSFEFRKQLFEYDEASNTFNKLKFPTEVWLPCRHIRQSCGFTMHAQFIITVGSRSPLGESDHAMQSIIGFTSIRCCATAVRPTCASKLTQAGPKNCFWGNLAQAAGRKDSV